MLKKSLVFGFVAYAMAQEEPLTDPEPTPEPDPANNFSGNCMACTTNEFYYCKTSNSCVSDSSECGVKDKVFS